MADLNPIRRIRVRYLGWHHPKVWAAYYDLPGREACYMHTATLDQMWEEMGKYFRGEGLIAPLRVDDRHMKYIEELGYAHFRA